MSKKIVIIGAGMMGSALAFPARENGNEVCLVGTPLDKDIIDASRRTGRHPKFERDFPAGVQYFQFEAWKENRRAEDDSFASYCDDGCFKVFGISALTGAGMAELTDYLGSLLEKMPLTGTFEEITAEEAEFTDGTFERELFGVEEVEEGVFEVTGPWIENLLNSVNLADYESSQYFQRTLRQRGVIDRLLEAGIKEGETVRILDTEFDFEL